MTKVPIEGKEAMFTDEQLFKKFDSAKLKWHKFPWRAASAVLGIMHHGADKYGWDNWRKGNSKEDLLRYWDAAFRHMIAELEGGELTKDDDSDLEAMAHAACSLMFYLDNALGKKKEKPKPSCPGCTGEHCCCIWKDDTCCGQHGPRCAKHIPMESRQEARERLGS